MMLLARNLALDGQVVHATALEKIAGK